MLMAVEGGVDRMRHMAGDGNLEVESFLVPLAAQARENALKLLASVSSDRQQLDAGKGTAGLPEIESGRRCLGELEAELGRICELLNESGEGRVKLPGIL